MRPFTMSSGDPGDVSALRRIAFSAFVAFATFGASAQAAAPIEYNRDIRPILADNCFQCHGPDSASRKADLRIDRRDAVIEAGVIVPGKPDDSTLLDRIFADEPDEVMPPAKTKKTLTAQQKDLLKSWIAAGAEYQPHWSFIAPKRSTPPAVKNEGWIKNPIDRFILATLEARGLQPAPEADRRTLARRVSLDLTGLPPKPADVEAFVNDQAPDAYERYVDRMLASSRYGEHQARYWLDAARYGDTHGIHIDNYREMWSYRDWVIAAFNRNMPFDQFTIEQLAGDLLPNRTTEQQIASGFNRCNITTSEGGAIAEEYLVNYNRDRTETTSQVWLGITAGCAVCHDHKFDPLSQKEFYEMAAFFNNTTQAAMDGNIKDTPPILFVPKPDDETRWPIVEKEVAEAKRLVEARKKEGRPDFDRWLAEVKPEALAGQLPSEGLKLLASLSEGKGSTVQVAVDGKPRDIDLSASVAWHPGQVAGQALQVKPGVVLEVAEAGDFEKDQSFSYGAWIKIPKTTASAAVFARMDEADAHRGWDLWIENDRVGTHIIHKWPENALKVFGKTALKPGEWHHVFVTYNGSGKAAGVTIFIDGKPEKTTVQSDTLKDTIKTKVPFRLAQRHTSSRFDDLAIQDVRIYGRALSAVEVGKVGTGARATWLVAKPAAERTDADKNELYTWWLSDLDPTTAKLGASLAAIEKEEAAIKARGTLTHVMQERAEPAMAYILFRGEYDKRRDPVKPSTPAILPPMPPELPRNRLGFAQWLLRPDHPLTARVTVNRFWQDVFGTGLVRTAGDFGVTGELPSHPELIDWLAVEFREAGWDVKKFLKLLVTSAAYRQSAATTPEKVEKDPQNRLLSRGPRFRMDAEMVRDYALAASGLLVEKTGGPSVKPYQPEGVWEAVAMPGSNTRNYTPDKGEGLYRRSLYTFWKRSAPPASMDIFNAPSREICTVRRERTDTPLQALVTLNDPQFVEAARFLAEKTLKEGGPTPEGRLDFVARRLLARPLRADEGQVVQASLNELFAYYKAHADDAKALVTFGDSKPDPALDAPTLAAWTMLANEMLNLDEVLNK